MSFSSRLKGLKKKKQEQRAVLEGKVTNDFFTLVSVAKWNSLGFSFYDFLLPYILSQVFHATGIQIGIIASGTLFGTMISSLIAGYLADRMSKRKITIFGGLGRAGAYILFYITIAVVKSLPLLMTSAFLLGFVVGFFWVPYDALISQKSDKNIRSQAFGLRYSSMAIGIILGGAMGYGQFAFLNWVGPSLWTSNWMAIAPFLLYSPFLIYAVANVYACVIFLKKVDENSVYTRTEERDIEESKQELELQADDQANTQYGKLNPIFIIGIIFLFFSLFLTAVNNMIAKPFIQIYLIENISNNPTSVVLAYAPGGLIAMILSPTLGKIADRLNPGLGITIFSIIGALMTFFLINVTNLIGFSLVFFVDAAFSTGENLLISNIFSRVSLKHRGKTIGLSTSINNLGGMVGPIVGGILWDVFFQKMPFIVSIFVELALIAFYLIGLKLAGPYMAEKIDLESKMKGLE